MVETQKSISDWANETFGPAGSDLRVATRANEEMAELLAILSTDYFDIAKAREEAADVCIVLYRLAERADVTVHGTAHEASWLKTALDYAISANDKMSYLMLETRGAPSSSNKWAHSSLNNLFGCLRTVVNLLGSNLDDEIDRKMAINRARKWELDGSGHGYHV